MTINWLTGDAEFYTSKQPAWESTGDNGSNVEDNGELGDSTVGKHEDGLDDSSSYTIGASIGLAIMIVSAMMF